jgi:hypothetical protein
MLAQQLARPCLIYLGFLISQPATSTTSIGEISQPATSTTSIGEINPLV